MKKLILAAAFLAMAAAASAQNNTVLGRDVYVFGKKTDSKTPLFFHFL